MIEDAAVDTSVAQKMVMRVYTNSTVRCRFPTHLRVPHVKEESLDDEGVDHLSCVGRSAEL